MCVSLYSYWYALCKNRHTHICIHFNKRNKNSNCDKLYCNEWVVAYVRTEYWHSLLWFSLWLLLFPFILHLLFVLNKVVFTFYCLSRLTACLCVWVRLALCYCYCNVNISFFLLLSWISHCQLQFKIFVVTLHPFTCHLNSMSSIKFFYKHTHTTIRTQPIPAQQLHIALLCSNQQSRHLDCIANTWYDNVEAVISHLCTDFLKHSHQSAPTTTTTTLPTTSV